MPGTRKVGMRETENGRVVILITRGPRIALLEITRLGVRAELHHAERVNRTRKHVAIALGSNERIHGCCQRADCQYESRNAHGYRSFDWCATVPNECGVVLHCGPEPPACGSVFATYVAISRSM